MGAADAPYFVRDFVTKWCNVPVVVLGTPMADKKNGKPSWIRFSGIGIEFASAVAVFTVIGYYIDEYYNSKPTALLICIMLGLIGGMYNLIRQSLAATRNFDKDSSKEDDQKKED
jgi:F0F1-type ATP synthase assembly protein I